jgi:hypothetical protein
MERYQNNIQNLKGDAISGVTVTVNRVSDGGVASIFSDNSSTPKANPFTNDVDGEFFFYAANDRYNIFFTGPITDQKDDVILFDTDNVALLKAFTDIVTATPPTTEAVTGGVEIRDFDGTDLLASFGFGGNNSLAIKNRMHGGSIFLEGQDVGGVSRPIFAGDPDGASQLYNAGLIRFIAGGSGIVAIRSDGNTDTENRYIVFEHQNGIDRGRLGYVGSDSFFILNDIDGGKVEIRATDSGGSQRSILDSDPDGQTILKADTNIEIQVAAGQRALVGTASSKTGLYFNNIEKIKTVDETATDQISGAEVLDGEGNFKPVGLGVSDETALSTTGTFTPFTQARAGRTLYLTAASAANIDTFASTGASQTDIPDGAMWFVQVNGAGAVTFRGGASVTIRHWAGLGAAPVDEDVVIPRGTVATVRKVRDTVYDIWKNG